MLEPINMNEFVGKAWESLESQLAKSVTDDERQMMAIKTAFWAGGKTLIEATIAIDDFARVCAASGKPTAEILRDAMKMREDLFASLEGFSQSLKPKRNLH